MQDLRDPTCTRCKLGELARSQADVCKMNPRKADVLIVTKIPPSAKAQGEIVEYMELAGWEDPSISYMGAVRCRVFDNIGKTDIKICSSIFLDAEVKAVAPKVIVCIGNEALLALTGKSGITKYRGSTFDYNGIPVFATISPAMVVRNPGLRDGLIADFRFMNNVYTGNNANGVRMPEQIRMVMGDGLDNSFFELYKAMDAAEGCAVDIETNGFNEDAPGAKIISIALTLWGKGAEAPESVWSIALEHPGVERDHASALNLLDHICRHLQNIPKIVAHNGKFDLRWINHHWKNGNLSLTFDTMLAAHILNENRPKGLKPLAQTHLGVEAWAISTKSLDETPLNEVLRYNALDTWYTAYLYFMFRAQLRDQPRLARIMTRIMVPASNVFTQIERDGIYVHRDLLEKNALESRKMLARIDRAIMKYVPEDVPVEPNLNPSTFSRWLLFTHLGLPVLALGKQRLDGTPGQPSMAEATLQHLQADHPHPVLKGMLARTKWQKFNSGFFTPYLEQIDEASRIHTTFKLTGTVTGRLSSGKGDDEKVTGRAQNRGVNLQQVPRDQLVRGIFGAAPGNVFIEFDYSQVELRVAAFLARESNMIHLYQTGKDIHMTMAMRMTGKPESEVTKDERKKAKAVNFGFLYGMGWKKFIETAWSNYGVVVNEEEAQEARRAFFAEFPELQRWHGRQRRLAAKYKRVESPIGRVRHLPDIDSRDDGVRSEAERQSINSPVQSFASDLTILSLITLDRLFKKKGLKARSVGTVHDAINFEVPINEVTRVVPMIKYVMENLPLEKWFGVVLDIPIVADCKIGTRWGDAEEVDSDVVTNKAKLEAWMNERYGDAHD